MENVLRVEDGKYISGSGGGDTSNAMPYSVLSDSSVDLNDVTDIGVYCVTVTPQNAPIGYGGTLIVTSDDSNIIYQHYYSASQVYTYTRFSSNNGSTWFDWKKEAFNIITDATTDLNNLTQDGIYHMGTVAVNQPEGNGGTLIVASRPSVIYQTFISAASAFSYGRYTTGSGSTWSAWANITTGLDARYVRKDIADTKKNMLRCEGAYGISAGTFNNTNLVIYTPYAGVQAGGRPGIGFHAGGYVGAAMWLETSYGFYFTLNNGALYQFSIVAVSSKHVKDNVEDMTENEAKKILDLEPISFTYKDPYNQLPNCDGTQYGLIAEDVLDVIPQAVSLPPDYGTEDQKGYPSIQYEKLVPHLLKMIQIQQKQIDDLTKRVEELERS